MVDQGGSPIQGADVDITRISTNEIQDVKTNGEGYFLFPPLTPGAYIMHAAAPTFSKVWRALSRAAADTDEAGPWPEQLSQRPQS